eukprot:scaffold5440_cov32-Tisochrysis_lutea.AAC.1
MLSAIIFILTSHYLSVSSQLELAGTSTLTSPTYSAEYTPQQSSLHVETDNHIHIHRFRFYSLRRRDPREALALSRISHFPPKSSSTRGARKAEGGEVTHRHRHR